MQKFSPQGTDRLLSLKDLPSEFEQIGFKRPHPATIARWCRRSGRPRLRSVKLGRQRYTRMSWVIQFAEACACNKQ